MIRPDENVIRVMDEWRKGRAILHLSRKTHITRITLTSWCRGNKPTLGVLLENYFIGTSWAKDLAHYLIDKLYPDVLPLLPPLAVPEPEPDEPLKPIEFTLNIE